MLAIEHAKYSALVRSYATDRNFKEVVSVFSVERDDSRPSHSLCCPDNPFYEVRVTFSHVVGRPDLMRITSSNWRCEDEVNGVFSIGDARRFYAELARLGFRAF